MSTEPAKLSTGRRKKIRLDPALYATANLVCSMTICSADRIPRFTDARFADAIVAHLALQASASRVTLHAYCLMPDHLHLLVSPNGGISLVGFVQAFKSRSTRLAWEHGHDGAIWQPRFYDHFLRQEEDIRRVVEYILNNPVRQGIVADWHDYRWCGAPAYDC